MMYTAHLVTAIKVDGKTMREFKSDGSSDIFIPFGSDYSLYLKNMDTRRAVISVEIDGEDVLDGQKIVVDGNSSTTIEGFLDGNNVHNKFRFIEKTEKVRDHRGEGPEDGLIRIQFQFEEPTRPNYGFLRGVPTKGIDHDTHDSPVFYSQRSSGIQGSSFCSVQNLKNIDRPLSNDEGITVAGAQTDQKFGSTYVGRLDPKKHVMVFKLKGETLSNQHVIKPVFSRKRTTCPTCGDKAKSGAKFCSECSTALV